MKNNEKKKIHAESVAGGCLYLWQCERIGRQVCQQVSESQCLCACIFQFTHLLCVNVCL